MCVREGERYQETWREGGKTERLTKNEKDCDQGAHA